MKETAKDKTNESMQLKVGDASGEVWTFKLKKSTKLGKVFKEYSTRSNASSAQKLRFIYKGRTLSDQDTPESLEMGDNEAIEVFSAQVGGGV